MNKCFWLGNQNKNKHSWQKRVKKIVPGWKTRTKTNIAGKKGEKIVPGWEKARTLWMLAGENGC